MAKQDYMWEKDENGKYRQKHRLIVEKFLGRKLSSNQIVHHIDGNKKNNILSNLKVMTREEHSSIHGGKHKNFRKGYSPHNKLPKKKVDQLIDLFVIHQNYSKVAKLLNISDMTVRNHVSRRNDANSSPERKQFESPF